MAVIKDYMEGTCHIKVYDDCIRSPEESKEIMARAWEHVYEAERRKLREARLKAEQEKGE
jgi:hypothetical protein